jgi:hypothetical protein
MGDKIGSLTGSKFSENSSPENVNILNYITWYINDNNKNLG